MLKNELTEKLNIRYPIIQAPMAGGITTTELVTAVSLHGGLGMIGAGYMSPNSLRKQIQEVKVKTEVFGVNLFVPMRFTVENEKVKHAKELLQPIRDLLLVSDESVTLPSYESWKQSFHKQVQVLMDEKVPICSFTFGIPEKDVIEKLKESGMTLIGTATTVEEALEVERKGLDLVVVQGTEAGGHRGNFLTDTENSLIGLMSLIPQVVDRINIPVIAAGGIMDARGLLASLILGAQAVQMGTAFMLTEESGTNSAHKNAILQAKEDDTTLTRTFSGKYARGIKNDFITMLEKDEGVLPPFPVQNTLTSSIRKVAGTENNAAFMSLWCGQSPRLAKRRTVSELMEQIVKETEKLLSFKF